jgi:hypothetical protein
MKVFIILLLLPFSLLAKKEPEIVFSTRSVQVSIPIGRGAENKMLTTSEVKDLLQLQKTASSNESITVKDISTKDISKKLSEVTGLLNGFISKACIDKRFSFEVWVGLNVKKQLIIASTSIEAGLKVKIDCSKEK